LKHGAEVTRDNVSEQTVSVIIPVYNDENRIINCVDSVFNQEQSGYSLEVIVVDNGSTDRTLTVLKNELQPKYERLIVEVCSTPGSYAARNAGLAICSGEFVAFTDSDCIVSKNWIENHLKTIKRNENSVGAGEVTFFPESGKTTEQSALDFETMFSMKQQENAANGKCITANFFCNKQLFNDVGLFNASLKSGGDVEMSQRVVESGGSIVYQPNASVAHPSRNKSELVVKRKRIVGGTWDSALSSSGVKGCVSFVYRLLKMFLGRSKKVLCYSEFSFKRKLSLVWLLFIIFTVSFTELIALAFGKQSNRQ